MNFSERKMLDLLRKGRDEHGVLAVKAEFEAEGTRPDELLRLLELAQRANLEVALKIGGCEAVSDLHATKMYGAKYIVAPMVETPYALSKFIDAKRKVYAGNEERALFYFNLETQATLQNLNEILEVARGQVDGIVFGRVDFTLSRKMGRDSVNEESVTQAVLKVAEACSRDNLELVLGGGISTAAIDALRRTRSIRLDRFETRKIIFDGAACCNDTIVEGIANAVQFELEWLKNKRAYYKIIAEEDDSRIAMMEARLKNAEPTLRQVA